jgi:hypothetical protein
LAIGETQCDHNNSTSRVTGFSVCGSLRAYAGEITCRIFPAHCV